MTTSVYPSGGMFGGRLNAYLQGRRAKIKHAKVTLNGYSNEVQTLTLTSFDNGDTIKLTHATVESAAVTASAAAGTTLADFQAKADALFAITIPGYVAGDCVVTETTLKVTYVFTFSGASVAHTDISALTATSGTGSASGVFAETNKGQTGKTTVTGILREDVVLFVYDSNDDDDLTTSVVNVIPDSIEIDSDTDDGHTAVVAWLTRR